MQASWLDLNTDARVPNHACLAGRLSSYYLRDEEQKPFGIGIIKLELPEIDTWRVLYSATPRQVVDWEMVQKLFQHNEGYRRFIADVRIDFSAKKSISRSTTR